MEEPEKLVQDYKLVEGLVTLIMDDMEKWSREIKGFKFDEKKLQALILRSLPSNHFTIT